MQAIQYKGCSVYAFGLERSLKRILDGCNFNIFIELLLIRVECFDSYLVYGLISLKMELQSSNLWPSTNTNNLKINVMVQFHKLKNEVSIKGKKYDKCIVFFFGSKTKTIFF